MKDSEAGEVHRNARDFPAAALYAGDAGQAVVAEKLVEDVASQLEVLVDLDVDQRAVDEDVSIRAADQLGCRAERRIEHARPPRAKVVGPDERKHVAHVLDHRAVDREQFQSADPLHQVELGKVDGRADECFVRLLHALFFQVFAMEFSRLDDDGPHSLQRGRRNAAALQDRKALFRDPAALLRAGIELLEVEAQ